ncbi:hypothetical protein PJF56_21875 [Roseofilum sp. BLCC_M91]|uniref:Uncharacterized protein n=1 Tax=Roseofilum halophilum BLCC-M91 TaxID=3022259 RepID=A0ABT7BSM6_9CYAN|nr:hypothetical protein [Roseofilum halophilum]MDJ1181519.1 hypothetical protein [Roseofilum halophilum BLCC-M91]
MLNYKVSPILTHPTVAQNTQQKLSADDRIEGFSQLVSGMIQSLSTVDLPEGVEPEDLQKALEEFRERKIQQIQEQISVKS